MEDAVESEFSGDIKKGLRSIVEVCAFLLRAHLRAATAIYHNFVTSVHWSDKSLAVAVDDLAVSPASPKAKKSKLKYLL
eukprot:1191942-Prorocentrum_minimum.AAC.2